jgi:hypothetical protein
MASYKALRWAPYVETVPVAADLAAWFQDRLQSGALPTEPFEIAPAVAVASPATLYDWIAGVITRRDRGATAREAECSIRSLMRHVGASLPHPSQEARQP